MPRKKKVFYGWWIVLAAFVLNILSGGAITYGFTAFFNPIRNTFGWKAAATSIAFVLQRVEFSIMGPVVGILVDRVGARKMMLPGWCIVAIGFLWMSRINSLWEFYGSFLLVAIGMSFALAVPIATTVTNWFSKKRSRALTILMVGIDIGGILVPAVAWSIGQFGWRQSLVFISIGLGAIGIPLSLAFRHKPEQYGYLPDGETPAAIDEATDVPNRHSPGETVEADSSSSTAGFTTKEALKTRTFWLLCSAFFFQMMGLSSVMVHIVPYLESVEFSTTIAATMVMGVTLCAIIGRVGFGFAGDFTNKRYLIAFAIALQTVGLFIFSLIDADRVWLIIPFLLTYAPGQAGPIILRMPLQADYFGRKSYGTIFGLMMSVSMLGGLVSPVIAGWIFDTSGSYHQAWQLFALLTIPAIPLILLAKAPKPSKQYNFT